MLFNSTSFLFFFPVSIILYFLFPRKIKWVILLATSYFFYMCWKVEYVFLILLSTAVDYYAAIGINRYKKIGNKRLILAVSLFINLGLLFTFKYYSFIADNFNEINYYLNSHIQIPYHQFLLPVGISFYTFQTLSYTIDVYKGKTGPEKHFGKFAVFVSFWPQLVAGPIERSHHLLPQLKQRHSFTYENLKMGLTRMAYGFFKKMVVADRMAIYADHVFEHPENFTTIPLLLAAFFFAIQIYADFSGYSDIAIGSARIMGVNLMDNFNKPYLAESFSEFWKRWHISLSTWFRDYVYIPLGGNRVVPWRRYFNLMATFILSGLWHGANWTFIVWGGIHGILICIQHLLRPGKFRSSFWKPFKIAGVFTIVSLAWIFFRSPSISQALSYFARMFAFNINFSINQISGYQGPFNLAVSFFVILLLFLSYRLPSHFNYKYYRSYLFIILVLITLIGVGGDNEFIYFQF